MTDPLDAVDKILNTCFLCKRSLFDDEAPVCYGCSLPPAYPDTAPNGQIFVCQACGKTTKNMTQITDLGWDESCMVNAVLCFDVGSPWEVVPGYEPRRKKGRRLSEEKPLEIPDDIQPIDLPE